MNGLHCYTIIHDTSCHMDVGYRGANIKIKLQKKRLPSTVGEQARLSIQFSPTILLYSRFTIQHRVVKPLPARSANKMQAPDYPSRPPNAPYSIALSTEEEAPVRDVHTILSASTKSNRTGFTRNCQELKEELTSRSLPAQNTL